RFYLSLEDELMRLFATGLMQRVMDKSFDDDVPLESKMVSKAVERAQGTVEGRNFEIRKDVLKYDEVMNEQRKIIYRRRQQILDGEDLRDAALDAIESAINRLVDQYCGGAFVAEWQREGFDMVEAMMGQIEDDFVQYVFHLQVVVDDQPQSPMRNVQYSAPTDPVQGSSSIASAMAAEAELMGAQAAPPEAVAAN